jgi:hypothetical protein
LRAGAGLNEISQGDGFSYAMFVWGIEPFASAGSNPLAKGGWLPKQSRADAN